MGRSQYTAYDRDTAPRYVVVWDLQWSVIKCQQIESGNDLFAAMTAAIERLRGEGWGAEGNTDIGFVFRNRDERRLLMITARDPHSCEWQSFSPFRSTRERVSAIDPLRSLASGGYRASQSSLTSF
jgi:hypothetical protein